MTLDEQMKVVRDHQNKAPVPVIIIARELGMRVFRVSIWDNDLSGKIKKVNDEDYRIYVNADHPKTRRRFTIAHEIAHFILHRGEIGNGITDDMLYRSGLSNQQEAQANMLAA